MNEEGYLTTGCLEKAICWGSIEFIHTSIFETEREYDHVDLAQIHSQLFLQQNKFIKENQRSAIQNMQSNGKPCPSRENQRRGILFYGLVRDCCKQRVCWSKQKGQSIVTSLAELWLPLIGWAITEQGERFSSLRWVGKLVSLPIIDTQYVSSYWNQ